MRLLCIGCTLCASEWVTPSCVGCACAFRDERGAALCLNLAFAAPATSTTTKRSSTSKPVWPKNIHPGECTFDHFYSPHAIIIYWNQQILFANNLVGKIRFQHWFSLESSLINWTSFHYTVWLIPKLITGKLHRGNKFSLINQNAGATRASRVRANQRPTPQLPRLKIAPLARNPLSAYMINIKTPRLLFCWLHTSALRLLVICAAPRQCQGAKKPLSVSHYSDYSLRVAISNYHHHNSTREFHTNSLRGWRRASRGVAFVSRHRRIVSTGEKSERVEKWWERVTMRGGERISLRRIILMD